MRSLMFVPGHRQRMIDKALASEADVLLLDIEDGVPPAEKDVARETIAASLRAVAANPPEGRHPLRFVRINAIGHERMHEDLGTVLGPGLEGFCLPKVETPDQIREVDELLASKDPEGTIRYVASIESALGLLNAPQIAAASPRMAALMFGAEDFSKDLGLPTLRVAEASELLYARSAIVMAATASHIQSVDGVWPDIRDPEGLLKDTLQARRLGFTGKSLIHPGQIEIVNNVFRPDQGEVDYARRVIEAFEEAQARGDGAIAFGGQLIDAPIVDRARRTLAMHEALGGAAPATTA
ncbi:MAG TPA: CoA ester lyase [Chloroflexota bacterium]|nr:CoA ester lyase [Chloroflexota bacterium]